jgi:hypothetical protein
MKSDNNLSEAVQKLERDLPPLMKTLDAPALALVMHGYYEKLMTEAPPTAQDELHDSLRLLMVRAGVVQRRSPPWGATRAGASGPLTRFGRCRQTPPDEHVKQEWLPKE